MKILFIVDYYQPKIGYGSYYIPKELSKLGHEVTLLTSNLYYPFPNYAETAGKVLGPRENKIGENKVNGVRVVRKRIWFEFFTRAFFGGQLECIRKYNPQIVIVDKTAGFSQIVTAFLKVFFNYKLISVDAHLPSGFKAEGNLVAKEIFYGTFRVLFSGLLNSLVDKFIAVQEGTVFIMKRYYGIKRKIVHIPLGTDTLLFKKNQMWRNKIRNIMNIKKSDYVVLYSGKIIKEKGLEILFQAMSVLLKKGLKIKMVLVGSGPKDYLDFCFSKLEKQYWESIINTGFVNAVDLYKYYSAADLAVWPLQESMSMNDAASCELPFIANDSIGAKFRTKNNNAILYRRGNYRDLSNKIQTLYTNRAISKKMGKNGRQLMEQELSWSKIAQRYIE